MQRALTVILVLSLSACSGGGGTAVQPASAPVTTPATNPGPVTQATTTAKFTIAVPAASSTQSANRSPAYISASTQSIIITLATVNGTAFTGTPASIATNLTTSNAACSSASGTLTCTASAPAVAGSDTFSVKTYDTQQTSSAPTAAAGNVLSTATVPVTVVAGQANAPATPLVLSGVPATLAISGVPAGTAGTALAATAFIVTVKDADGNTIVGSYANPVTLAVSDTSGATSVATSGSDNPPAGELLSSSDAAKVSYTGLAIVPVTLSAAASGATSANGSFAPTLQPITTTAPLNGITPEIALTRNTSSSAFTASEVGWTNAPYNKLLSATQQGSGCAGVGTTAPGHGTTFTTTVAGSPAAATCTLTLSDFTGGSTATVTLAYVTGFQAFSYSAPGGQQNFTVPFGVTTVTVVADGAVGGTANATDVAAGQGGQVQATIPAPAGTALAIFVGGAGGGGAGVTNGLGGFNGGANGGGAPAGGGGGASTVSSSGTALVVAGGGGGGGVVITNGGEGGNGGGSTGQTGAAGLGGSAGGGGGTTSGTSGSGGGGGAAVCAPGSPGAPGTAGSGGAGGTFGNPGGGGGGGYYGGGGGGGCASGTVNGGGGGGGSSYAEASATSVSSIQGGVPGNGSVTLTW